MAIVHVTATIRQIMLQALKDAIDSGGAPASLDIYSGQMPATPEAAVTTQVLLGTLYLPYPCTASPGSLTSSALTVGDITPDASADASGVATWARISSRTNVPVKTPVIDIDVSSVGGGGVLQMNTVNFVVGGPILVSSLLFRVQ